MTTTISKNLRIKYMYDGAEKIGFYDKGTNTFVAAHEEKGVLMIDNAFKPTSGANYVKRLERY